MAEVLSWAGRLDAATLEQDGSAPAHRRDPVGVAPNRLRSAGTLAGSGGE